MRAIGNILWFIFGGLLMGVCWILTGLVAFVSVVGIPWAKACFIIAQLSFLPFGKEVMCRQEFTRIGDIGTGVFGTLGNLVWFIFAGAWLAIGHILCSLLCFISVIGIPFGIQHLKLAGLALFPIGKIVVDKATATAARRANGSGITISIPIPEKLQSNR